MSKIKLYIKQSWLLIVSAFIFGLLLAMTNAAWSPRIEQNKIDKLNALMDVLIADASFEKLGTVEINLAKGKTAKSDVYKATGKDSSCKGYCFNASGAGFADKIELVIAVDGKLEKIQGYSVLSSNETPGFGTRITDDFYRAQFIGAPMGNLNLKKNGNAEKIDNEIIAISGATVSSTAVVNIFNSYLEQMKTKIEQGIGADGK